jgi:lysophospholipase L1-like esterase
MGTSAKVFGIGNAPAAKVPIGYQLNRVPNFTGAARLVGGADTFLASGSTGLVTFNHFIEAEAPFTRVRLWLFSKETTAAAGITAVVAPSSTDNMAGTDAASRYYPSGSATNNAAYSSTVPYGWRPVTWVGNTSTSLEIGSTAAPSMTCSDWIECESLPAPTGMQRPVLMIRAMYPASQAYTLGSYYTSDLWSPAVGNSFYRRWGCAQTSALDGVGTLSNVPSLGWSSRSGAFIAVEFDYCVPVRSVLAIGDSITAGGGGQSYMYDSWACRAVLGKSTPQAPFQYFNGGMSGQGSSAFITQATAMITNGMTPTDVLIPAFTPNDGSASIYSGQVRHGIIVNLIKKLRSLGTNVYMWIGVPNNGYSGTAEAARVASETWARSLAAQGLVTLIDFCPLISDGGNPARYRPEYYQDGIHPNLAAIKVMAKYVQSFL